MKNKYSLSLIFTRTFLIPTIILVVLTGVGCYHMFRSESDSYEKIVKVNAKMYNRLLAQKMSLDLKNMFNDIELACSYIDVQRFLKSRNPVKRSDLELEYISLCNIRKVYDQVRILGLDGMELIRVNYNDGYPAAVAPDKLQNKNNRYYFRNSLELKRGEIYVSPFDLNVENGEIEQPLKPMIRVTMPIYDDDGQKIGFAVLNYLGQKLLDGLAMNSEKFKNPMISPMLLNNESYWLFSPDKSQEWAFMYQDRKGINLKHLKPEAWKQIYSSLNGQFTTGDGLYTFDTIIVAPESKIAEVSWNGRNWKIVCLIPASTFDAILLDTSSRYLLVFLCIFLIILFGTLTRANFIKARASGQKKLEAAKQAAEDANRAKSDFLARMSHEIRTPMNAIIGLTHLALKTEMTPKQHDYLTKVDISAKSLLGIINDILDFSKIEAGRLELEKTEFLLDDVFNDILNILGLQAGQKGLELILMVRSTVPNMLVGDRLRLGQVLMNLTGNSIKFTGSGEIVISAELIEDTDKIAVIRFSVKDSGIGISPKQAAALFQPFSQADGSISRRFGGTGLGLVISKKLVTLMGGTMELKSEAGKGSEFIFTIPFQLQEPGKRELYLYPEEIRGMRVLVVDDSRMFRMVLDKVLQSFTFRVDAAESGEQALELLHRYDESDCFKLVITDWRMPDIDGIELAEKIKYSENLVNVPKVIMLTAYGNEEVRYRAEKVDLDGFMLKPFDRSIMFDTIMEVFSYNDYRLNKVVSTEGKAVPSFNINGTHVLLAEDNDINQQVAREILEDAGVTVSIANNGKEALEMIKTNAYSAVLMDIQMPVMDGLQAVKIIREDENLQSLPVIAMTAHALVGDREKSLLAGMNDHITKPIDPDILIATLSKWLPENPELKSGQEGAQNFLYEVPSIFNQLSEINVKKAISRLRGNTELFKKLLISFVHECDDLYAKLISHISKGENKDAQLLAHSMRGTSGNISAESLQYLFQEIENSLSNGADIEQSLLDDLEAEKNLVIKEIFKVFPQAGDNKYIRLRDEENDIIALSDARKLLPKLRDMAELLKKHDIESQDVYNSIKPQLTGAAPNFSKELGESLGKFDFTYSQTIVEGFIAKYEQESE
ncbi:response regulator [Desulfovibrio gilichinskyi]|uniref:Sensory/regulatory protein RpfC n=1 Tax=Desulfovibrio gilichinskyi TaxID=1519643 RepID=A0A1X7E8P6_9BACT|nr:response regulator [Desulfovibrio gilichinskyi]SMF29227.1 Hpt domain-containing protein [Desulfovibrio gilichinskyi]